MRHLLLGSLLGCALALSASAAGAAPMTVTLDSVTGVWRDVQISGGSASGVGTSTIKWGRPATWSGKSGYRFEGIAPPQITDLELEESFLLGEFTHFNKPIYPPSITGATLEVTSLLTIVGSTTEQVSLTSVFGFNHDETTNKQPCQPGSVSVCDDIVTFTFNKGQSTGVDIAGLGTFFVDVSSFLIDGKEADSFFTREGKNNTAQLLGRVTKRPGEQPPSSVPEPATGLALAAGLFGMVGVIRRRRPRA